MHRKGRLRNHALDDKASKASRLNFVIAAFVYWNTLCMGRAVEYLRRLGVACLSLQRYSALLVKRGGRRPISHVVLPAIGLVITLTPLVAMRRQTLEVGGAWLALGCGYFCVLRFVQKRSTAMAA